MAYDTIYLRPGQGMGINYFSPQANGLIAAWPCLTPRKYPRAVGKYGQLFGVTSLGGAASMGYGLFGSAYVGTAATDYAGIGNNIVGTRLHGLSKITVMARGMLTTLPASGNRTRALTIHTAGVEFGLLSVFDVSGTAYFTVGGRSVSTDSLQDVGNAGVPITANTWSHWGGTLDFAGDKIKFFHAGRHFVDTSVTFGNNTATWASSAANYLDAIGSNGNTSSLSEGWVGSLCDIRLYDRELTDKEWWDINTHPMDLYQPVGIPNLPLFFLSQPFVAPTLRQYTIPGNMHVNESGTRQYVLPLDGQLTDTGTLTAGLIKSRNNLTWSNVKSLKGLAKASVKSVNNLTA